VNLQDQARISPGCTLNTINGTGRAGPSHVAPRHATPLPLVRVGWSRTPFAFDTSSTLGAGIERSASGTPPGRLGCTEGGAGYLGMTRMQSAPSIARSDIPHGSERLPHASHLATRAIMHSRRGSQVSFRFDKLSRNSGAESHALRDSAPPTHAFGSTLSSTQNRWVTRHQHHNSDVMEQPPLDHRTIKPGPAH